MARTSTLMPDSTQRLARRHFWTMLGAIALALGAVGILVPLLPTTPFLILAAYFFSRGSQRLHDWLIGHRVFGPPIRNWREHRAIATKAKLSALLAIGLVFALSVVFEAPGWALALQGVVLFGVAVFLLTRPTPPGSRPGESAERLE